MKSEHGNPGIWERRGLRVVSPVLLGSLLVLIALGAIPVSGDDQVLSDYARIEGLRGTLNAAGSDTMLELQTLMAEGFRRIYPEVMIQVEGKGSATAPQALNEGTVQIGNMSRIMQHREIDGFEERHGYPPTRIDVAVDTLAVFVNQDNPIESMTIEELDAAFSRSRRCGGPRDITTWGQLGLDGSWATAPISLYGRNAASGTYGFFKKHATCRGDYKNEVKEQPGSASVVQGVENDLYGIGYSGIGYATSGVRAIAIAPTNGGHPVAPTAANARTGAYPLTRFLHVYVNKVPGQPLDRLTEEYVRYMLSADGQTIVVKAGYEPLPTDLVSLQLEKLE